MNRVAALMDSLGSWIEEGPVSLNFLGNRDFCEKVVCRGRT